MIGKRYGRLTVVKELPERSTDGRIVYECLCDCGNIVNVSRTYLTTEQTRSCGCLKKDQDQTNLREEYDSKRVNGVAKHLFKGKEPRKDSSTGFRGVSKYITRGSKKERYRAWITVNGKRYYKSGFLTAEEAYYEGRLPLENKYLPKKEDKNG